jgi:hypothetical protein
VVVGAPVVVLTGAVVVVLAPVVVVVVAKVVVVVTGMVGDDDPPKASPSPSPSPARTTRMPATRAWIRRRPPRFARGW